MSLCLKVSDLWKRYNGLPALRGCSFSLDQPGVCAISGPNGSGKSTLLRLCALLEEPEHGTIEYLSGQVPLVKDIELRRRITLVLPHIGIFNTSVFRNVAYGLRLRGVSGAELEQRTREGLERVGLAHKKKHPARTLSSGERQRLGIARAVVLNPSVLLLDEPTAFVDQKSKEIIEAVILGMEREHSSIVMLATHDQAQIHRLAQRILFMQEGEILKSPT